MMFVEVNSIQPKNCKLIVNIEYVTEIAPLVSGGCVLFFSSQEAGVAKTITVSDDYSQFKQFVVQTVTAESIEKRFPTKKSLVRTNIKAQEEGKGVEFSDPNQYGESA
jgi:hypothetical protein